MNIIRSILRRPSRSLLTAFGISIGIFALVVIGSLSERVNLIVNGGLTFYQSRIVVEDKGNNGSLFRISQPINLDRLPTIQALSDVKGAYPEITMLYQEGARSGVDFSSPPLILGIDPSSQADDPHRPQLLAGRELQSLDIGAVVIGEDLQRTTKKKIGETMLISGSTFRIVGVYAKNFTVTDNSATITLRDAQLLYHPTTSQTIRSVNTVAVTSLASEIVVYPKSGVPLSELVQKINAQIPGVTAIDPHTFQKQVENSTRLFNTIIFGCALVALLIGSVSVINTMVMAVSERVREIGIRKALGASDGRILLDFIGEAGLLGLMGGILGVLLGEIAVQYINFHTATNGSTLFEVTPRLLLAAYAFSLFLAILAGLYPAYRAARLLPINALSHE